MDETDFRQQYEFFPQFPQRPVEVMVEHQPQAVHCYSVFFQAVENP